MQRIALPAALVALAIIGVACVTAIATLPSGATAARTEFVPRAAPPSDASSAATVVHDEVHEPEPSDGAGEPDETQPPEAVAPRSADSLIRAIQDVLDAEAGGATVSVVAMRLVDGRTVSIEGDRVFYAASLFKLAVLYEALRLLSAGEIELADRVQISAAEFAEDLGTGGSLNLDANGGITISDALEAMVTRSDNVTAIALQHHFGGAQIDATLAGLGLTATSVSVPALPTTAGDMARLMAAVVSGQGLSEEAWALGRDLLIRQEMRDATLAGLPPGVTAGAKWGAWSDDGGAGHDVAFVEAPSGTYVLAVLTNQPWAWPLIADISRAVYDALDE